VSPGMATAPLPKPVADAVHLTAEALLAQLAPEPRRPAAALTEALVEIGGVVAHDGLANTEGGLWICICASELAHCAVIKVEPASEFSI